MMRKYILYLLAILLAACSKSVPYSDETIKNDLRVPAYPLLMLHPHLRLWSTTDQLTEKNMIFTNGKNLPFVGFLRVDGTMYRFMGRRELPMQAIATMVKRRMKKFHPGRTAQQQHLGTSSYIIPSDLLNRDGILHELVR